MLHIILSQNPDNIILDTKSGGYTNHHFFLITQRSLCHTECSVSGMKYPGDKMSGFSGAIITWILRIRSE